MAGKVEEARRDPRINARFKRALESWATHQPQSVRTLRIHDGKAPTDGNTFLVTTGPPLMGHDRNDRDDREDLDDVITIDSRTETAGAFTVLQPSRLRAELIF